MFLIKKKNNSVLPHHQAGQAVLIVLLSLSVVLIIVLYIMSRSITDISLTSKEEDSMRAFSAAEAGIERALVIGTNQQDSLGGANFSATVSDFARGSASIVYPINLNSGEMATFWFARPSETAFTGSPKICWATSAVETPAIEISVYYIESGVYKIYRNSLDPDSARALENNFTAVSSSSCTIEGTSFTHNYTDSSITGLPNKQFMTIKLLYNENQSHKVGIVASSGLFPSQGLKINSDGSFESSNRTIEVYQLHSVVPSVFMNAIYSPTGITK